jgi:hypothetical protein
MRSIVATSERIASRCQRARDELRPRVLEVGELALAPFARGNHRRQLEHHRDGAEAARLLRLLDDELDLLGSSWTSHASASARASSAAAGCGPAACRSGCRAGRKRRGGAAALDPRQHRLVAEEGDPDSGVVVPAADLVDRALRAGAAPRRRSAARRCCGCGRGSGATAPASCRARSRSPSAASTSICMLLMPEQDGASSPSRRSTCLAVVARAFVLPQPGGRRDDDPAALRPGEQRLSCRDVGVSKKSGTSGASIASSRWVLRCCRKRRMSRAMRSLSPAYLPSRRRRGAGGDAGLRGELGPARSGDALVLEQPFALLGDVDRRIFGVVHGAGSSWLLVHDPELALRIGEPVDEAGSGLRRRGSLI